MIIFSLYMQDRTKASYYFDSSFNTIIIFVFVGLFSSLVVFFSTVEDITAKWSDLNESEKRMVLENTNTTNPDSQIRILTLEEIKGIHNGSLRLP